MFPAAMPIMHPSYFHTTTTHAQALSLYLCTDLTVFGFSGRGWCSASKYTLQNRLDARSHRPRTA
jgi:hypothetical protein